MSEKADINTYKFSEELLALSKRLEKQYKPDDAGVIATEKEAYVEHVHAGFSDAVLKAADKFRDDSKGLTAKIVEITQASRDDFITASAIALGHVGAPYLKKHKAINTVEVSTMIGKDRVEATFDRVREYPGRGEGAEKIVKYGVLTAGYTANGAVGSRGTLKRARQYLNDFASEYLAG